MLGKGSTILNRLHRRMEKAQHQYKIVTIESKRDVDKYEQYIDDPVGFARDILHLELVPKQQEILWSLLEPPYCVFSPSGNELGKTLIAASTVLWWHCTRSPSIIITTAPKYEQVRDVLWKEIRRLAKRAGLKLAFLPKACRIERSYDDFAIGVVAKDETSFKGQHGVPLLFVVEEASGVEDYIFNAIETMFSPPGHAMLVIFNCDAIGTRVHSEMMRAEKQNSTMPATCKVVRMSAIDHPNIEAELKGLPPPVPQAMRLGKFEQILKKHSNLVGCGVDDPKGLHLATDILWPPPWAKDYCERTRQQPQWYRPGPKAEVILLGRYPRQGKNAVWSEGDWMAAVRDGRDPLKIELYIPEFGCDVAAFGDDNSAIHVRSGCVSLWHEEQNGQSEPHTMGRLKELAAFYALWYNEQLGLMVPSDRELLSPIRAQDIPMKVDNDGLGGTLSSFLLNDGYNVIRIGAGTNALEKEEYPNRRSELWFTTAERARTDELDLSQLQCPDGSVDEVIDQMRRQAMSVTWSFDNRGRRVVMSKDDMKKEMGRSPDTCDALNLSFASDPDQENGAMPEILSSRKHPLRSRRS